MTHLLNMNLQKHAAASLPCPPTDKLRPVHIPTNKIAAFSLLEVMIAMAIFFMAVFSILALVSNGLRNAAVLLEMPVDAGMLAAELAETNRLEEGFDSGDFGDIFPNYKWVRQITQVGSNGLYQVDFAVIHDVRGRPVESRMSILLYRPGTGSPRPGMLRR